MIIKLNQILSAVKQHEVFVTAVVAKGCIMGAQPDVQLKNWIWDSDLNYTMLEVIEPIKEFQTPFVAVLGYKTVWGNN